MSYDDMNRLTARTSTGGGAALNDSWTYDRWGNRWTQAASPGGFSGQLTFNAGTNQAVGYSYDAAGNLLSDTINTYSYDAEGNMVAVNGGQTARYDYDAGNRRVRSDIYGSAAELVYDLGGRKVAILQAGSGNVIEQDLHLGAQPLAVFQNGVFSYEHQDWLGTERLLTDGSGNTAGSYGSLPFGDNFLQSGADVDPYHFAGLDHDYESGLDHAQFREYSSAGGRWLSPDPYQGSYDSSNPQSLNRYSYVLNDPLSQTDPLGLDDGGGSSSIPGPGLGNILADILNALFYHPTFNGTLNPRPNSQPLDEGNFTYGPNIAGALGLPDATCEFGPCGGGGFGFSQSDPPYSLSQIASFAQCASAAANRMSLAALLPKGTPVLVQNIFSNDISTISDIITGPNRLGLGATGSYFEGKGLNAAVRGIGGIAYTADKFTLGVNGAGTTYAKEILPGIISQSAAGKAAGAALGTASTIKLAYDIATYAGAFAVCTTF